MEFWKKHIKTRLGLMLIFFVSGMSLVIYGWTLSGKQLGLGLMLLGLACLLTTLSLYNKPFETPKNRK